MHFIFVHDTLSFAFNRFGRDRCEINRKVRTTEKIAMLLFHEDHKSWQ